MKKAFSEILVEWQKSSGRHDLPWQGKRDPYAVWVSEIMLQQTQVSTVIPYYQRFIARFPDVDSLARASLDEVLSLWSGLGYYARARNLHKAATIVSSLGKFPDDLDGLSSLPGIGRSTAAAISVFSFSKREAILDGNVKRVLSRVFAMEGYPGEKRIEALFWEKAEALLPLIEIESYTQGLMDLGASLCSRTNPQCPECPMKDCCEAHLSGRIHELPQAKPKKPLPLRETDFLVLKKGGKFYFERRPEKGVWAEMLCFPERKEEEISEDFVELPGFIHVFTHFRLKIGACLIETEKDRAGLWLSMEEALSSSIPNPVRRILEGIRRLSP